MTLMNSATDFERPQPSSLKDLFWSFTKLALQGFGGVLAVVQLEMVERKRWLTQEEFIEEWAGALKKHPLPMTVTVGSALLGIVFVAVLHWPMIYSLVTIGGLGCVMTYRKLAP